MSSKRGYVPDSEVRDKIRSTAQSVGYSSDVTIIILKAFNFMMRTNFVGGCHALSSMIYVALREIGENPVLCIGEVRNPNSPPFDHSWVRLNGKVIDVAIYCPLERVQNSISGVIVGDIDVLSGKPTETVYGYVSGVGNDAATRRTMTKTFTQYMDGYAKEANGLWTVAQRLLPQGYSMDIAEARKKYEHTERVYERVK